MPGLKVPAEPCCTAGRGIVARDGDSTAPMRKRAKPNHDGINSKMMAFAPAEISSPEPQALLRQRLCSEMEALRGLLKKALLVRKAANDATSSHRGKDGRFLAAEARPEATEAERTKCAKKRKTMPLAEIVEPKMSKDKIISLASRVSSLSDNLSAHVEQEAVETTTCAKKRKTMPLAEIVKPRMSQGEIFGHASLVSSLSANMPTQIEKEEAANASGPISRPSQREKEDGELTDVEEDDVFVDICGLDSPVSARTVPRSSPHLLEDSEIVEEEEQNVFVDKCGDASPVVVEKFTEAVDSPSSSSSSSGSSRRDSSSDSDSSSSSGSSCSDSYSDSESSDSDDDNESIRSSPAPVILAKTAVSPVAVANKALCSSPCLREDGEIEEGECGRTSPVAAEKLDETGNSPRSSSPSGSADDKSVRSSLAPVVLPERDKELEKPLETQSDAQDQRPRQAAVPAAQMSDLLAKAREKMRQLQRERAAERGRCEL